MAKIVGNELAACCSQAWLAPLAPAPRVIARAADDCRLIDMQAQTGTGQAQLQQLARRNPLLARARAADRAGAGAADRRARVDLRHGVTGGATPGGRKLIRPANTCGAATLSAAPLAAGVRLWGYGEMYYIEPNARWKPGTADLGARRCSASVLL